MQVDEILQRTNLSSRCRICQDISSLAVVNLPTTLRFCLSARSRGCRGLKYKGMSPLVSNVVYTVLES